MLIGSVMVLGALLVGTASASEMGAVDGGDSYLFFGGSYLLPDDARNLPTGSGGVDIDSGTGFAAAYGHRWTEHLWWEVQVSRNVFETDDNGGTDFYNTQLGADLVYAFGDRSRFTPFALIGLGAAYNDVFPDDDDATGVYGNLGLGFVTGPLARNGIRMRAEARYIYDDFESGAESGMGDTRFTVGIEIPLNRVRTELKEVVRVVEKRVEVPVKVLEPNPDSDGDGVVDGVDRCPNTIRGAKVDQYGCAIKQAVTVLKGVHFAFDSARLTPEGEQMLRRAVKAFDGQPKMTAVIDGHTDSVGSEQYNQRLSVRRADAVMSYLVVNGISANRLSTQGHGESRPIASNRTDSGRALNRRVDFNLSTGENTQY